MSKGLNAAVVHSLHNAADSEYDQFVWNETMMEVDKGWLAPSSLDGECFVAKRFPVPRTKCGWWMTSPSVESTVPMDCGRNFVSKQWTSYVHTCLHVGPNGR